MMYHIDMEGRQVFEKINFQREERIDLMENPLLGPMLRRKEKLLEDEKLAKRANKIAIYYLNMHKRYDLDNYLQYRPITAMDWFRGVYHLFMIYTGLADTYRNEQYFPKLDIFYNFEREMIGINFGNPEKSEISGRLLTHLNYKLKFLI